MKILKYFFLVVGIIYLIEVLYIFVQPKPNYEIFGFDVPLLGFVIFRLFVSFAFIWQFKNRWDNNV